MERGCTVNIATARVLEPGIFGLWALPASPLRVLNISEDERRLQGPCQNALLDGVHASAARLARTSMNKPEEAGVGAPGELGHRGHRR